MKLKICGAAGTVTGSCHLLTLDDGYSILLDCGLYQGSEESFVEFNEKWHFDPRKIDAVILSHAHIDHSGRLPKLVKDGFAGYIFSTPATRDLCSLMLLDSAVIQVRDAEFIAKDEKRGKPVEPLYNPEDAQAAMEHFICHPYNMWYNLTEDVSFIFHDSGHILGSASVTLRIKRAGYKDCFLGFTADIGRPNRPILRDPVPLPQCDYVICESTYGNRIHESPPDEIEHFLDILMETCVRNKGRLIIPAFSVGRTQELVYMMDRLHNAGRLPDIPVYIDSPLSCNATDIFRLHPDCFDKEMMRYMIKDPDPFGFDKLFYIRSADQSKKLNTQEACVIISASGMANAGRIRHHISHSIGDKRNTILMVGFCAPGTLGRQILDGNKTIQVFGEERTIKCRIEKMSSFSAHGDKNEMIDYLRLQDKSRLRSLFLVHGEDDAREGFNQHLSDLGFHTILMPALAEEFEL